jgi:hypothetical protein
LARSSSSVSFALGVIARVIVKRPIGSKGFLITIGVLGLFIVAFAFPGIKQRRDMATVREFINRVQPQLVADPRFKGVQLLGYSCDYIMHPYIPVDGTVASRQDWQALESFIRASKPPVFISVRTVRVASSEETAQTP